MISAERFALVVLTSGLVAACGGTDTNVNADGGILRDAAYVDTGSFVPGEALTAPDRTWTWVDFPNTHCLNGSATGLGVYLNQASDKVIIYLDGGGACFNDATCDGVANPNGYGAANFSRPTNGILSDTDGDNPFRDWNKVFIPYCTGDIYAGANADGFNGHMFLGYVNMGEYMNRLVPTFGESSQVVLSGSSAGGFGATYNYDRTQQAFGDTPVYLLNDSAPLFSSTYMRPCLQEQLRTAWNLDATLPRDCASCFEGNGLSSFLPFLANKYPNRRMALISSERDNVIRYFYGFGLSPHCDESAEFTGDDYVLGLEELRDDTLAASPNFSTFYIDSAQHVWLMQSPGTVSSGFPTTKLSEWLPTWLDSTMPVMSISP